MPLEKDVLHYHRFPKPGKIETVSSKPLQLLLGYTPGVAFTCKRIQKNPDEVYLYSGKGNSVAVISNGTAVLGLGNIGPLAAKPLLEGKAMLLREMASINSFDIVIAENDIDSLAKIIQAISPTFGAILLEDIAAPSCFDLTEQLEKILPIPFFHDDQEGTAIVVVAALLNALIKQGKKIGDINCIIQGAGAAGIATASLLLEKGLPSQQLWMIDSQGLIHHKRTNIPPHKQPYVSQTGETTVAEIFHNADVFIGLSKGDTVSANWLKYMAPKPIVFALANPIPEVDWEKAHQVRKDLLMATGGSHYPNQVNNLLVFPFMMRVALDFRVKRITRGMIHAAVIALQKLTPPNHLLPPVHQKDLFVQIPLIISSAIKEKEAILFWDKEKYFIYLQQKEKNDTKKKSYI